MRRPFRPFGRLAVLGLGLLGGSVALAARERGAARRRVGSGRRRAALAGAVARGVVDAAAEPEEAVEGADLVLLATPVHAMPELLRRVAPRLASGALVTDVGSVKGVLSDTLPGLLPPGVSYVGSHPMAGSHLRGVEHARADLFEGAPCVVTATAETDAAAAERIAAFWSALGARVVRRDPEVHDGEVAWMSHVPHLLAFAFARALEGAPPGCAEVQGPGFRDFTRIARSDAELWSDILTANRKAVAGPLQRVAEALAELSRALEGNDPDEVERFLARARAALARLSPPEAAPSAGAATENPQRNRSAETDS